MSGRKLKTSRVRITLDVDVSLYDFDAIMDSDIKETFAHLPMRIQESIQVFLLGVLLDGNLEKLLICEEATYKAVDALLSYWKEPDSKEFVKPGLEFIDPIRREELKEYFDFDVGQRTPDLIKAAIGEARKAELIDFKVEEIINWNSK